MWAIDSKPNPDETNEKWSEFSAKVLKLWQWPTLAWQNRWFLRDGTLVVLLSKHKCGHVARTGTHCRSFWAEPARYAYWLGRFSRFFFPWRLSRLPPPWWGPCCQVSGLTSCAPGPNAMRKSWSEGTYLTCFRAIFWINFTIICIIVNSWAAGRWNTITVTMSNYALQLNVQLGNDSMGHVQ